MRSRFALEALDRELAKGVAGVRQESRGAEHVGSHERLVDVELEMAL